MAESPHFVHVDQENGIHNLEDLVFEKKDECIGRFSSVYPRNRFEGTYDSLEADKTFHDAIQ